MTVKSSLAAKRKRATMRQDGADITLRSLIKDVAATRSTIKRALVVDIGGTSVKILATGQTEARSFPSGPTLTPARMASGHSDSIALYSGQLWINHREGLEPKQAALRIDVKEGGASVFDCTGYH